MAAEAATGVHHSIESCLQCRWLVFRSLERSLDHIGGDRLGVRRSTFGGHRLHRWEAMSHRRHELDELLSHPVRFSMVALLAAADRAEFGFVRDQVEVSDSVMSKQMSALEDAGYV